MKVRPGAVFHGVGMAKNHSGKLDERLLGFDARKMWLDPEIHWHKERRDHFLLRMDAGPVLSTDEIVWPSVFASHQMPLVSESQLEALGLAGSHRPTWIGPNIPLWDDLNRLKAHLGGKDPEIKRPYWIIAITCPLQPEIESQLPHGPYFESTNPDRPKLSWTFLGYDVSDGSLTSGLTNCGYSQDNRREQPLPRLAMALNPYHLFDALEPAAAFRKAADKRVKEHAPFRVYGLYLVEEVTE